MDKYNIGFPFKETVFDSDLISGETTLRSSAYRIAGERHFGVWFKAVSASSNPKLRLFYEVSYDETDSNFVEPDGATVICAGLSGEVAHAMTFQSPPMSYIKFGVQGLSGNPNDTVITEVIVNQ